MILSEKSATFRDHPPAGSRSRAACEQRRTFLQRHNEFELPHGRAAPPRHLFADPVSAGANFLTCWKAPKSLVPPTSPVSDQGASHALYAKIPCEDLRSRFDLAGWPFVDDMALVDDVGAMRQRQRGSEI